jgi:hypothetical protein
VSDYRLDYRAIGVRSPAEAKDFSSSLCVQTGSEVHPASCTMGTGGPFPGAKARPGRDADHSPHLVPRSSMSRSYTSSPPLLPYRCVVRLLYFVLTTLPLLLTLPPICSKSRNSQDFLFAHSAICINGVKKDQ